MDNRLKTTLKYCGYPAYLLYKRFRHQYYVRHPMWLADKLFYQTFNRHINWDNPQDLNEKINWLKFHADMREWARLADKYAVREYVAERGLADILVPLYGKWDTAQGVLDAWDSLPEEFVLKSNNGCGRLLIVSKENGGKQAVDLKKLRKTLKKWLAEKDFGLSNAELHYQFIPNCIIAEKLLTDDYAKGFSCSLIDYKIWCFHGVPYGCLIVYDRDRTKHSYTVDFYDLNWKEHTELMRNTTARHPIHRPKEWNYMLNAASMLSKGHPQVRVDFYNIDGEIYFGELTFTSACGYMEYFSQEALLEMGKQVKLDLTMPWNEFAEDL